MKQLLTCSIDVDVVTTLKDKAHKQRVSLSALVNELLREAANVDKPVVTARKLSTKAQIVLDAVKALHNLASRLDKGDIRFHCREYRMDEVCKKVGLFPSSALPALRECERAGVLRVRRINPLGMDEDAMWVDHWRLPEGADAK